MKYTIDNRALIAKKRVLIPAVLILGIFVTRAALVASGDTTVPEGPIDAFEDLVSLEKSAYRLQIDAYIRAKNKNVGPAERERMIDAILKNAPRVVRHRGMFIDGHPIDPVLFVTAFIKVESTFYRRARSGSGALGYMQLMPRTFRWMAAKKGRALPASRLYHTETNIHWGVSYINILIRQLPNPRLVVLAYNAGPNNVRRGVYRPAYWRSVSAAYRELRRNRPSYLALAKKMRSEGKTEDELLADAAH